MTNTFMQQYWDLTETYVSKYGPLTCVAMQKGTFYEIYSHEGKGIAADVAHCLNFQLTKCDKKVPTSPSLVGLPISNIKKYAGRLTSDGFTIVTVSESNIPGQRNVSTIYSPGTFVDDNSAESKLLITVCVLFENGIVDIGIASIDISTGTSHVMEHISGDNTCRIERAAGEIEALKPKEILYVYTESIPSSLNSHILNITNIANMLHHKIPLLPCYKDLDYQNETLKSIFGSSILTPLEHLDMTYMESGIYAFLNLLQFCYEHDDLHLKNLKEPIIKMYDSGLILHNNAVSQLNIIRTGDCRNSIFDILDKTNTPMGKRALKHVLTNPISCANTLNHLHNEVEKMLPIVKWHDDHLSNIVDIEKYHRKLFLNEITMKQWGSMYDSYENIQKILNNTPISIKLPVSINSQPFDVLVEKFKSFLEWFGNTFCISRMIEPDCFNPFQRHIYTDIDDCDDRVNETLQTLKEEAIKMSKLLGKDENVIKIETTTHGTFLVTTPNRASDICKKRKSYYQKKESKTKSIIMSETINALIDTLVIEQSKLKPLIAARINDVVSYCVDQYKNCLEDVAKYIAEIDLICSRAKTATAYGYAKPHIVNESDSRINIVGLRHALIERLNGTTKYIPSDVNLDNDSKGILLYGINGSGKSCYSKAIGIAIVMAQSGHWVAAEHCTLSPFSSMYTRTTCDDNIFKGHSSFFVEMTELKTILNFGDRNTIVIGDEICKGTEETSALTIVGTTINWLLDNGVKFVFATHLHRLSKMKCIDQNDLKIMHIHIDYDVENDIFVYNRKLQAGQGSYVYGIEIASKILNNTQFSRKMTFVKKDVTGNKMQLTGTKKSRYNSKVIVHRCEVCGAEGKEDGGTDLETHHIVPQAADSSLITERSNLVVLCKECHNNVHSNKLLIKGWISTSEGRKLDSQHFAAKV